MPTSTTSKYVISLVASLAMFMEAIDTTIINTAIPAMSRSLDVHPVDLKIALISYLLSLAIFIPISGWVSDKFGVKKVFITAVGIFTLSSLWCGFAHNLTELVIARSVQGLGGSLTVPVGRLILLRTFQRHELINVMNRVIMVASIGPMLGPVLGGLITYHYSWPWIFWVNVPFGIATMLLAWRALPSEAPRSVPPLDKIGFLLFGISLASVTFGFSAFSESTFSQNVSLSAIAFAVLTLGLYIWHSYNQPHPIVNTTLFKIRTFRISILSGLFGRIGFGGAPFVLPLMLQIALGYSPQTSGLLIAPVALGVFLSKFFSRKLLVIFGFKRLLITNTLLIGISLWSFMLINQQTSLVFIGILTFIFGLLLSLQFGSMNTIAYAEITNESLNSVSSIMGTNQQLSQSFGVALCAFLLRHFSVNFSTGGLNIAVFHHTFFIMGILTVISVGIFFSLKTTDGHELTDKATT